MMMIYGMMPFVRETLPYSELQQNVSYRWPVTNRVGLRPAAQFIGVGDEKITLTGELRPGITGGVTSVLAFKMLADEGRAWPLISGNGIIYGMYVVESYVATHSELYADGGARKIKFTLNLKRVDESITSLYGDAKKQAAGLISDLGQRASEAINAIGGLTL